MYLSALPPPSPHVYMPQQNRQYAPQTPSPLRTSRNVNLMPPPFTPSSTLKADSSARTSPLSFTTPKTISRSSSTSDLTPTPRSASSSASALPFQFQNRSRSQSPQASLVKSNAAAKIRRSSLFFEKVRQKREDSRFETRGEQALRLDFVRERRAWEERLKRRAPSFGAEVDDAMMEEVDQDMGVLDNAENAMPWPTEDREIEDLLSYLETDETHSIDVQTNNASLNGRSIRLSSMLESTSEDEDYDQLFLEVMADDSQLPQAGARELQVWSESYQDQDSSMDLS